MKDGKHYALLKRDSSGTRIVAYSIRGKHQRTGVLLDGKTLPTPLSFSSYTFSPDEKKILLTSGEQKLFRRSRRARYYLYDRPSKAFSAVAPYAIRQPRFSPDGKKLAFVFQNNLYIKELQSGRTRQITTDGAENQIINGVTDWVYEEEFAYVRAFEWSPDSKTIAYLKFDERGVAAMHIPIYGPQKQPYPRFLNYRYPKAGTPNPVVTAYYYNLGDRRTSKVDLSAYKDYYIPKLQWTAKADKFAVFIANRHQDKVDFLSVDRRDGRMKRVLTETDPKYIETYNLYIHFLKDNSFVWQSERDGYRHLYYYDAKGHLKERLTRGSRVVTKVYGVDEKRREVYYQSTRDDGINRALCAVKLNGKRAEKRNRKAGMNDAVFSPDFKYYLNTYSTINSPQVYTLNEARTGRRIRTLEDNRALVKRLKAHKLSEIEYFKIPIPSGERLNAWMLKPPDFDPTKHYPLLMYVYGGPGSQTVLNSWDKRNRDLWFDLLAQKGFIVVSVDNRGTGARGAAFKKMTYLQLGKYETADQLYAAQFLGRKPFIDASHIGIFGWSYGGFMASLCITKGAGIFNSAIAVAPVTNWRYYDSIYTERYMRTPAENPKGYRDNTPLNYAKKLRGHYLIIHGTADDNVHFQNTLQMDEALVQADKRFEMQVYKDRTHALMGGHTRLHLYRKMTRFLLQHLKPTND